MQEFEIKSVKNGIVLKCPDDQEIVFQDDSKSEVQLFADFLRYISSEYSPGEDSRYAKERIHVVVQPGDKSGIEFKCPLCGE